MSYWEEKNSGEDGKFNEFQRECVNVAQNVSQKGSHMFLVCIDGSDQSDEAFRSVMNLRRKFDQICVFHAFKGLHIV